MLEHMVAGAPDIDLSVTDRQSTDSHKHFTVLRQHRKVGVLLMQRAERAEDMRQNTFARRATVSVGTGSVAAKTF